MSSNDTISDNDNILFNIMSDNILSENINLDEISNKLLYEKIDEYKYKLANMKRKVNAYEKIITEQKNKIITLETKNRKIESLHNNIYSAYIVEKQTNEKLTNINKLIIERIKMMDARNIRRQEKKLERNRIKRKKLEKRREESSSSED